METTYTVAGTATQHGITKVRFANDFVSRYKILLKNKCDPINLIELPNPMTKLEALKHLESLDWDGDDGYAVTSKLYEIMKEAKKGEFKKEISLSDIRKRKVDVTVTPMDILKQTGFIDVDVSELELEE
jgi:hypothetical protein